MQKNCLKCGVGIPDGAKFCMECGSPVPEERLCESCGTLVPDGAQFCMECGRAVGPPQSATAPAPTPDVRSSAPAAAPAPKPVVPATAPRFILSRDWIVVHRKQVIIAIAALLVVVIAALILFPPTPAALSGKWEAAADAPRRGAAHIMLIDPPIHMLLKSNGHGYVTSMATVIGAIDIQQYGVHIQYEISGRKITFYSDDNQREEGTIWGNTIWAFNKKFVKQGN